MLLKWADLSKIVALHARGIFSNNRDILVQGLFHHARAVPIDTLST